MRTILAVACVIPSATAAAEYRPRQTSVAIPSGESGFQWFPCAESQPASFFEERQAEAAVALHRLEGLLSNATHDVMTSEIGGIPDYTSGEILRYTPDTPLMLELASKINLIQIKRAYLARCIFSKATPIAVVAARMETLSQAWDDALKTHRDTWRTLLI